MGMVEVPGLVRQRALANGEAGRTWLAALPDVVGRLAARWGLDVGRAFEGGTAAYVAAATDRSGRDCVLKVAMPLEIDGPDTFARSVLVHRLAGGNGCARLIDHDPSVPALLMERLGPNLHEMGLPLERLLDTVARTLGSFWRPLPEDSTLPTGADQAAWLAGYITRSWDELGRPCDRQVIDRAVTYCEDRAAAYDPQRAVLVHGDAHGWNTLDAGHGTFKLVDPEGLRSEPAHDLGVPMREYNEPLLDGPTGLLVRERAERLGSICAVDPEPIWEWGYIERVSTGLANWRDFGAPEAGPFLEVARRCL